jgi:hypothetical protein
MFAQKDPILGNRSLDQYTYASNNPVLMVDPLGMRPINKSEEDLLTQTKATVLERVKINDDYSYHRMTSDALIDDAIKNVRGAIDKVPANTDDPASLKALLWAFHQFINKASQQSYARGERCPQLMDGVSAFNRGDWKCNKFVADAYAIGTGMGLSVEKEVTGQGHNKGFPASQDPSTRLVYPPRANWLAQRGQDIRNLTKAIDIDAQGEGVQPVPGDIIAFHATSGAGHSALHIGGGLIISARGTGIEIGTVASERDPNSHHSHDYVSVRKYSGNPN